MRADPLVSLLKSVIPDKSRVLDIGAGDCSVAKQLSKTTQVAALDIRDYNKSDLELVLYDGRTIPFPAEDFDYSLLLFVLHHASDYLSLLREGARVGKTLVIFEDTPRNYLEYVAWRVIDYSWNVFQDPHPASPAKSEEEWERIFSEENLHVITKKNFRLASTLFAYQHTMFVLEKSK